MSDTRINESFAYELLGTLWGNKRVKAESRPPVEKDSPNLNSIAKQITFGSFYFHQAEHPLILTTRVEDHFLVTDDLDRKHGLSRYSRGILPKEFFELFPEIPTHNIQGQIAIDFEQYSYSLKSSDENIPLVALYRNENNRPTMVIAGFLGHDRGRNNSSTIVIEFDSSKPLEEFLQIIEDNHRKGLSDSTTLNNLSSIIFGEPYKVNSLYESFSPFNVNNIVLNNIRDKRLI